ncbi:MAG: hypothetical protein HDS11_04085 [Bacteroides sp.]|nr:hypothetical protein [Bacteroides sp.]
MEEIKLLRELQNKLTKQDFLRTLNWYTQSTWHKNKEFRLKHWHYARQFTWQVIYFDATFENALNGKLYYEIDEKGYEIDEKGVNFDKVDQARRALMIFNDYLVLFKLIHPHKKYQIPFKSFKRLYEEEQKLIKLDNQKRYAAFKKPFYQAKKWDKLKQNVANSDLNIRILDSVDKLVAEGKEQHNCIGDIYVEPAYQNECVILDYIDPKNDRYSIEVRYDDEFQDYYIEQCFLKYNEVGDSSIPQQIEQLLKRARA